MKAGCRVMDPPPRQYAVEQVGVNFHPRHRHLSTDWRCDAVAQIRRAKTNHDSLSLQLTLNVSIKQTARRKGQKRRRFMARRKLLPVIHHQKLWRIRTPSLRCLFVPFTLKQNASSFEEQCVTVELYSLMN